MGTSRTEVRKLNGGNGQGAVQPTPVPCRQCERRAAVDHPDDDRDRQEAFAQAVRAMIDGGDGWMVADATADVLFKSANPWDRVLAQVHYLQAGMADIAPVSATTVACLVGVLRELRLLDDRAAAAVRQLCQALLAVVTVLEADADQGVQR